MSQPTLSMMTYSFSNVMGPGGMTLFEVISFVQDRLGVNAFEIGHGNITALMSAREMKVRLDDLGAVAACIIGSGDFVQPSDAEQQPAIDAIKAAVDACVDLGCRILMTTTGGCKPGLDAPEARKRIAAGLQRCLPHAADAGVMLTIEDVGAPSAPYGTSDHLLEMCALTGPDLRLTYDNGNFLVRGEDPLVAMERLWDKVVHVHCKDWRLLGPDEQDQRGCPGADGRKYQGAVCGEGLLDYPANLGALRERGYEGFLSYEYEGPNDPREECQRGIANLRALL
jgi:sugar phosphate isomerase/epimerase